MKWSLQSLSCLLMIGIIVCGGILLSAKVIEAWASNFALGMVAKFDQLVEPFEKKVTIVIASSINSGDVILPLNLMQLFQLAEAQNLTVYQLGTPNEIYNYGDSMGRITFHLFQRENDRELVEHRATLEYRFYRTEYKWIDVTEA